MKSPSIKAPKLPGRPLGFSRDVALERAMHAFWRNGYEATSVADLLATMGISAPSLYGTFGGKKELFLEAMNLYVGDEKRTEKLLSEAPTAFLAVRGLLLASAEIFTGDRTPAGCLLATSTATGSDKSMDIRDLILRFRKRQRLVLVERIAYDVEAGVLPYFTDTSALAGMVMALQLGLAAIARDGAKRSELRLIIEHTMKAWPQQKRRKTRPHRFTIKDASQT